MAQYCIQNQNENSLISRLLTHRRVPQMVEYFDCHRCPSQHLKVREQKPCSVIIFYHQATI